MRLNRAALLAAVSLFPLAAMAQDDLSSPKRVFSDEIASGSWLRIRTMKGNIQVRESSGARAVVTAVRGSGRGSTENITFDIRRDGSNVTVCAIYPHTTRCDEDGYQSRWRRNDGDLAAIDFTVELPKGVKISASSGNGDVNVSGAGNEVSASSGNGEIRVQGSGGGSLPTQATVMSRSATREDRSRSVAATATYVSAQRSAPYRSPPATDASTCAWMNSAPATCDSAPAMGPSS